MTTTSDVRRTVVESNETHFESYVETVSELIYTPKGERDYGTLACYGRNAIGKQSDPCVFQVVPAAKPGALRNCTLRPYVVTSASLNSSNQTTMHANQLPTQYGRHESNYPHMEYVRERHNSSGSSNATARHNVANKNMRGRSSAPNKQLTPQQLLRLKKRTSFTPSQTLAAIERQRQRKQQSQQQQQQRQSTATKSGGDSKADGSPAKSSQQRMRRASRVPQQQQQQQQQHQLHAATSITSSQRKQAASNLSTSHLGSSSSSSSSQSNNGKQPAKYFNKRQKNMHKQQQREKPKQQQLKGAANEHNSNIIHHYAASTSSLSSSLSLGRRKRLAANDILATVAAASTSTSLSSPASSSAASLAATAAAEVEIEQDVAAAAATAAAAASGSNNKRSRKSLSSLDKQQQQQQLLPPNAPQISNQPVAAISANNVKETVATSAQGAVAAAVKDKASSSKQDSTDNDNDNDSEDDDDDDDDGAEMDAEAETNDEEEDEDEDEDGGAHDDVAELDEDVAQLATDGDYLADGPGDLEEYETAEEVDGQPKHVHMLSLEEQLDLESLEDNVEEEEAGDDDGGEVDDMYNVSDDDFVASVALSTSDTTAAAPLQRTTEGPHIREKTTQATQTADSAAAEWQLPHFDYSRMEYSFSNGVVTQSLLGGSGTGAGHDGFAGGGTINFDNYDNIIYSTMELECMPGYDGGLQQQFFLEAYDSKTKKLRLNMSSTYLDVPVFRIDLSGETVYLNIMFIRIWCLVGCSEGYHL
uniref:GG10743 n=1 Tax=Drosophila erecta TaxID=7220 RepID=B3NYI9_DROER